VRLEWLGEDLAVRSGETVAAHWLDEPRAEASAFGSSSATPESSVAASETEGAARALTSAAGSSLVS
jgi:hypothetical protein